MSPIRPGMTMSPSIIISPQPCRIRPLLYVVRDRTGLRACCCTDVMKSRLPLSIQCYYEVMNRVEDCNFTLQLQLRLNSSTYKHKSSAICANTIITKSASPVHTSNNVEATFDFVEATFDLVAFDNVASTLLLVCTGFKRHCRTSTPLSSTCSRVGYASPAWHSSLTKGQTKALEDVQHRAVQIISNNVPYEDTCSLFKLCPLAERRLELSRTVSADSARRVTRAPLPASSKA